MPHTEDPETALDERSDAPVPEQHGEPEEAEHTLTSTGRAKQQDDEPLPAFPAEDVLPD